MKKKIMAFAVPATIALILLTAITFYCSLLTVADEFFVSDDEEANFQFVSVDESVIEDVVFETEEPPIIPNNAQLLEDDYFVPGIEEVLTDPLIDSSGIDLVNEVDTNWLDSSLTGNNTNGNTNEKHPQIGVVMKCRDGYLSGVTIQLLECGTVVEEWVTDGTNHIINIDITPNKIYTIHQSVIPTGYLSADDIDFSIDVNGNVTTKGTAWKDSSDFVWIEMYNLVEESRDTELAVRMNLKYFHEPTESLVDIFVRNANYFHCELLTVHP